MSLNIKFFFHIEMSQIQKTSNNKNTFEYKIFLNLTIPLDIGIFLCKYKN